MFPAASIARMSADAQAIDRSLEIAAERCEDLTPPVYARFFAQRPDARAYFQLDEIDPRARGRMLAELLVMLADSARGEGYVRPTLATIVADHVSYGVRGAALYAALLAALREVLAELLGGDWTDETATAWERQCALFLAGIPA